MGIALLLLILFITYNACWLHRLGRDHVESESLSIPSTYQIALSHEYEKFVSEPKFQSCVLQRNNSSLVDDETNEIEEMIDGMLRDTTNPLQTTVMRGVLTLWVAPWNFLKCPMNLLFIDVYFDILFILQYYLIMYSMVTSPRTNPELPGVEINSTFVFFMIYIAGHIIQEVM